jgi:hypothetical protein
MKSLTPAGYVGIAAGLVDQYFVNKKELRGRTTEP